MIGAKMADNESENKQLVNKDDNEDRETITMLDVLEEENQLEEDAFAVLANSDDQHCTYEQGYVGRQALYACNTCQLSDSSSAAICLACSYVCHDGHQLFELYTKRNFRCDCGNDKFVDNNCKLFAKTTINDKNEYNHNFKGVYCTCERPYPDPDDDIDDQMIQCVVCEDWFHARHLGVFPESEDFAEMICSSCMTRLPFLSAYYSAFAEKIENEKSVSDEGVDITSICEEKAVNESIDINKCESVISGQSLNETKSAIQLSSSKCKLSSLKSSVPELLTATYWPLSWRSNLCKCGDCMALYTANKCQFLIDEKDMVHYYESEGLENKTKVSHYDKGISELKKMNRIQQIEYMSGYNDLKDELKEYLRKFVESNKVVREEDIKEFFEQMQSRKKQRLELPYHCK